MEYIDEMRLEITQDKLVDLLMHAATREDIANTRKDLKEDIRMFRTELKDDIVELRTELKSDIALVMNKLDKLDNKIDSKHDKVIWFIFASMLVPIVLHVFHF